MVTFRYSSVQLLAFAIMTCFGAFSSYAQLPSVAQTLARADRLSKTEDAQDAWALLAGISSQQSAMQPEESMLYHKLLGRKYIDYGEWELARASFRSSRLFASKVASEEGKKQALLSYYYIGQCYMSEGKLSTASDTLQHGLSLAQASDQSLRYATQPHLLNLLGLVKERQQRYEEALALNQQSIDLRFEQGDSTSSSLSYSFNGMGIIYDRIGQPDRAIEAFKKGIAANSAALKPNSQLALEIESNLSNVYRYLGRYDLALPAIQRLLTYLQHTKDQRSPKISRTLYSLAVCYKNLGELPLALKTAERALGVWQSANPKPHVTEINLQTLLAKLQHQLGDSKGALSTLEAIEKLNTKLEVNDSQEYLAALAYGAKIALEQGELELAEKKIRKSYPAVSAIQEGFHPVLFSNTIQYPYLLYRQGKFDTALSTLDSLFTRLERISPQLISIQRNAFRSELLQLQLATLKAKQARPDQMLALETEIEQIAKLLLRDLYEINGRKNQRGAVNQLGRLPKLVDDITSIHLDRAHREVNSTEQHLRTGLAYIDVGLTFLRARWNVWRNEKYSQEDQWTISQLSAKIAATEERIHENKGLSEDALELSAQLHDSVRNYERLLLELIPVQAQDTLFADRFQESDFGEEPFFVFFSDAEQFSIIYGQNNALQLKQYPASDSIPKRLLAFATFVKNKDLGFGESLIHLTRAKELYETLFGWAFKENGEVTGRNLRVILTKEVANIPLCALPISLPQDTRMGFRGIEFAVHRHAFQYYSSVQEMVSAASENRTTKRLELLAVAPITAGDSLSPFLPFATQEVAAIAKQFDAASLVGPEASWAAIKAALASKNVFHFSSHAVSNPQSQDYSYMLIADTTGEHTERLYSRSIQEMTLPAELVVLSSCETGVGRFRTGEGALSIASTFLDAGAASVINTLWQIDDRQSQQLILDFYDQLVAGARLDDALATAQRAYIDKAPNQLTHPYYWAAFSSSGLSKPIAAKSLPMEWMLAMGLLLLGVLYATTRKFVGHATRSPT